MAESRAQLIARLHAGQSAHEIARAAVGISDDTVITRFHWGANLKETYPLKHLHLVPRGAQVIAYDGGPKPVHALPEDTLSILAGAALRHHAATIERDITTLPLYQLAAQDSEIVKWLEPHVLDQRDRTREVICRTEQLEKFIEAKGLEVHELRAGRTVSWFEHTRNSPETLEEDILSFLLLVRGTSYTVDPYIFKDMRRGNYGTLVENYVEAFKVETIDDLPLSNLTWGSAEWESYKENVTARILDPLLAVEALPTQAEQAAALRKLGGVVGNSLGLKQRLEAQRDASLRSEVTLCELFVWTLANADSVSKVAPVLRVLSRDVKTILLLCASERERSSLCTALAEANTAGLATTFTLTA